MEFEFHSDGRLRYANNSKYKNDVLIRKEGKELYGCNTTCSWIEYYDSQSI